MWIIGRYQPLKEKRPKVNVQDGVLRFYHLPLPTVSVVPWGELTLCFSIAVRDRMVPPPPPPHHLYAKANTSSSIFLHWRRPAFTTAQIINYTIRCNPVGLQNASLVLYLQTYVAPIDGGFLCSLLCSYFLPSWASLSFRCEHLSWDLPYLVKCLGVLHVGSSETAFFDVYFL